MNNVPITNLKRTKGDILVVVYVNADIPPVKLALNKEEEKEQESRYKKWLKNFNEHLLRNHSKEKTESLGFMSVIDSAITTGMLTLANYAIEKGNPDILINISRTSCGTYDFYKTKELVEIGRIATIQTLDKMNS